MHPKLIVHSYAVNLRFMRVWPRCRLAKVIKRLASLIRRWGDWAAGPQWRSGDSWQCESGSQARARGEEEVTQDADENILEVCHFQGDAKKYELRPSMRLEALLLALAGQSIRAEVVDYGESFFPGPAFFLFFLGREKISLATEKACFPGISKNCGKSCYHCRWLQINCSRFLQNLKNHSFLAAKSVSTFL